MAASRPPTISDVAREAGVGRATAARTLGGYGSVSDEARGRVMAAADRLGYRPNQIARSMSTGRSDTVGVVLADVANPFFSRLLRAIDDRLREHGLHSIVVSTDEQLAQERDVVELLLDKRVDGLIVASAAHDVTEAAHLVRAASTGLPVVLVDRAIRGLELDTVASDNRAAGREATMQLLVAGHSRVAFVWGPETREPGADRATLLAAADRALHSEAERLRGYLDALESAGVEYDPALVTQVRKTETTATRAVAAMLATSRPPTGIVATETDAVTGALRAIREAGLRCPSDISLVGIDDSSWAAVMDPPLTMVDQPIVQIGSVAAERVMARIGGERGDAVCHQLPVQVIRRASVARLAGA